MIQKMMTMKFQMATLSEEFVFEYFSQLNPIAYRIQAEINQTIENYEHYWNDLDKREQMTIINEAVIKPEIQLNYNRTKTTETPENSHPYRDIDASLLNYFRPKAEIDRPFTYKTISQENLFYSLAAGQGEVDESGVCLPVPKPPKNHQMNKSTDSLTCVTFVNLNMKTKKGRAPAAPTKMTIKPPPPPIPVVKKVVETTPVVVTTPASVVTPAPVPEPKVIQNIPKVLPEDTNSNTSLISPADEEEDQVETDKDTPPANEDEIKLLLDSNGFDFLNNW